jgi:hypothetical protein
MQKEMHVRGIFQDTEFINLRFQHYASTISTW